MLPLNLISRDQRTRGARPKALVMIRIASVPDVPLFAAMTVRSNRLSLQFAHEKLFKRLCQSLVSRYLLMMGSTFRVEQSVHVSEYHLSDAD